MEVYRFITCPIQVNTYLAADETKTGMIVDPGDYSQALTDLAAEKGIRVAYIVLTHGHGDHIGGVEAFQRQFPDAKVVACEAERMLLGDSAKNGSEDICGRPVTVEPDRWVRDGETLTVGQTDYTILHTPGHTPGGMCLYTPGCLFSGDTLFRASVGRTDFYGGDYDQLMRAIREKLFTLPPETRVLPGHMGETTIGYEKEHNPFV